MKQLEKVDRRHAGTSTVAQFFEELQTSPQEGLSSTETQSRLENYGPNRLREAESKAMSQIFIDQFKSGIVIMLLVAVGLSLAFGDFLEAGAIAVVIIINGLIGFLTELKAVRSMEALQELGSVEASVVRDGQAQTVPAENLVPGDLVLLDSGDVVTADIRLSEAANLQVDESALTGESVPVSKQTEPISEDVPLAEQKNMVFKGTAITQGSGKGVIASTGMDTELGRISSLVEEAEEEVTPLEQRLDALGHKLIWVTIGVAALVGLSGIIAGQQLFLMIETAIALAIAAIPEGLPIVATIALARGMRRMAKRNALMNQLSAVETLGSTTVICADKTGTLTQNKMTATLLVLPKDGNIQISGTGLEMSGQFTREEQPLEPAQHPALQEILEVAVFCNNAALPRQTDTDHNEDAQAAKMIGDPMEVALLVAGSKAGIQRDDLLERFPEEREEAFDPRRKMMATFHRSDDAYRVAVKGAVEAVLDVCSQIRQGDQVQELTPAMRKDWNQRNDQMAENGLRVLAFATKISESADEDPYQDLQFLGLVGLIDPPREDVQEAIKVCKQAGVKVIMITGDQIVTARNVGKQVGLLHEDEEMKAQLGSCLDEVDENAAEETRQLLDVPIFARVSPEQKLRLIALHQQHGEIVAMTGDGVNDAPALEKADIGIAMGQHGTQVAREAADMILKDDAFSTIIEAVRYGRVIFGNIRKFVTYLLSGNAGEILIVGLATLFQAPLPLLPLQILFLNFVADVFPALALGVGVGTEAVMQQKPRDPKEPVMTRRHWITILNYGVLIALTVLAAFGLAYRWFGFDSSQAVTISFLTLAFARLWHVFNMRAYNTQLWRNEVTTNPWVWGALLLCLGLLFSAIYIPVLAQILKLVPPTGFQWLIILGMSLIPLLVGQIVKFARVGMAEST